MWEGGPRRGRSGGRGGNHGVRGGQERRHWRGGHGGVSVWGYSTYRWWGRCYRHRAHEKGYSIRRDRCGVSGGSHRTRGRCYSAVRTKGGTVFGEVAVGLVVGATEPVGGATGAGHRPMCARWRSTAAIAAAVTASTIWFKEGGESASEAFIILELGTREGRRCVTGGLNIRGGNDGVSLSCSAAWNITGVTCRRSRSVRRGCGPESLSKPEKVARLAFPRPLEGSSRRR